MTDNLNPTGPSQPSLNTAYTTAGNPADSAPSEQKIASQVASGNKDAPVIDERLPSHGSSTKATPSSLGYGIHGAPPGEESKGLTQEQVGRNQELEGEQMRASGEGEVASAVDTKRGATGTQVDMASDLDRKKAEQAPAREAIMEQRKHDVDVGGVLSDRGGPANPVGKNNYPNSGD